MMKDAPKWLLIWLGFEITSRVMVDRGYSKKPKNIPKEYIS